MVLVSSPALDAVSSASATLNWLMQHGHSRLVRQGHVVLSTARPGSQALKLDKVCDFSEARCQSIHVIPFDPHLAEGADVEFEMLKPTTRQAYIGLAGALAENFQRLRTGIDGRPIRASKYSANGAKNTGSSSSASTRANSAGNTNSSDGKIASHNVG
jgi:MinD-like ATPase involved in chromosome partitioning or flagellar assembly